jgi:hypothetical protein
MSNTINGIPYVKYDPKIAGVKPYYIALSGGRLKYTNSISKSTTIKDFNKPVKYDKPTNRLLVGTFNFDPFSKEYTKQFQDIEGMLKYSGGMIYRTEVVNNPLVNIGNDEEKKDEEKKEDKPVDPTPKRRQLKEEPKQSDDKYKTNISEDNILYYHQPTSSIGEFTIRGETPFLVIKRTHGLYMRRLVPDWKNKTGDDRFYKYPDGKTREYEIKREANTYKTQYSRQQYSVDKEIVNGKDGYDLYRDSDLGGKDHEYHFGDKEQTKGFFGPKLKDDKLKSIEEKKEASKAVYTSKEQQREALDRIKKAEEDAMKKREEDRKKDQEKKMDNVEGPGDFKPLDKSPPKPPEPEPVKQEPEPEPVKANVVTQEPRKLKEKPAKDLGDAQGNIALQGEAVDLIDPKDVNLNVVKKVDEYKMPDKEIKEIDLKKPDGTNFTTENFDRLKTSFNIDRFLPDLQKLTFQQYYNKLIEEHPRKLEYFLDETDIYLNSFYQFLNQLEDTMDARNEDLYQVYGNDEFKNVSRGVPIIKNPNLIEQDDVDYSFDDKYLPEMLNGIFLASLMFNELDNEKVVLKDDDDVIVETYLNHTEDALKSRVAKQLLKPNKMDLTQFKFLVIMTLVGIFSLRKKKAGPKRLRNIVARVINNIPYTKANLEQQQIDNVFEKLQTFYKEHPYPFEYGQLSQFYDPIIEYLYLDNPRAQFNYFFRHVEDISKLVPAIEEKFSNRQSLKDFILNLYEKQKESRETFKDFNRYTRGMRRLLFEDFAKNFEDGVPIFEEVPKGAEYEITNERTGDIIERVFIPFDENKKAITLFINEEGRFYESREDDRADTREEMIIGADGKMEEMPLGTIDIPKDLQETNFERIQNWLGTQAGSWLIGRLGLQTGKLFIKPFAGTNEDAMNELTKSTDLMADILQKNYNYQIDPQELTMMEGVEDFAYSKYLQNIVKGSDTLIGKVYRNFVRQYPRADELREMGIFNKDGLVVPNYDVKFFGEVGNPDTVIPPQDWNNLPQDLKNTGHFDIVEAGYSDNLLPPGYEIFNVAVKTLKNFMTEAIGAGDDFGIIPGMQNIDVADNLLGRTWVGINPIFLPVPKQLGKTLIKNINAFILGSLITPYFKNTPLDRLRSRNKAGGQIDKIDLNIGNPLPFKNKNDIEILNDIIRTAPSIPFLSSELKFKKFRSEGVIDKVKDFFGSTRPSNWQEQYMAETVEPFMEKYAKFMTSNEKYNEIAKFVISAQAYHQNFDQRVYIPLMEDYTMEQLFKILSNKADEVIKIDKVYKISNPRAKEFWGIFEAVPFRYRKVLYDYFNFSYEDMEDATELLDRDDFVGTLDKNGFLADELPKFDQEDIDKNHEVDLNKGEDAEPSIADYRYITLAKLSYKINGMNKQNILNEGEEVFQAENVEKKNLRGTMFKKNVLYKIKLNENELAEQFKIGSPEYFTDVDRDFIYIRDKNSNNNAIAVAGSKVNPMEQGFGRDWRTNIFGTFQHRATKIMNILEPYLSDNQNWYISGHSLGSATGNLLALRIGRRFNVKIHYVGFATPGCLLQDKVNLYSETLKKGLYKNYYIYNDIVGKISLKMVVPENNNFVLYKNGWKEVGLDSTFFNQIQKVKATIKDNAHGIDLYQKYLRIAVKRGELKKETYESKTDMLLNFDKEKFLKEHPDIEKNILNHVLAREPLIRKRIRLLKKINPNIDNEDILATAIYEISKKILNRMNKSNKETESRQQRLFPEQNEEPKKTTFTDFSKTSEVKSEGFDWLSWSKTVSNLFGGNDEL